VASSHAVVVETQLGEQRVDRLKIFLKHYSGSLEECVTKKGLVSRVPLGAMHSMHFLEALLFGLYTGQYYGPQLCSA
jgi:hypothetical protein